MNIMTVGFPETYAQSRDHFRIVAESLGAELLCFSLDIGGDSQFSIDVALLGAPELPAIVVSSGLHGVEGPFGAAVQLAWLNEQRGKAIHARYIFIHALNPYGYAMGRRVNEHNVDLNRNFLQPGGQIGTLSDSSKDDYRRFDALLNPAYPPRRLDMFMLKSVAHLALEGRQQLQNAIVTGQYAYPQGLFYGGCAKSQTTQIIEEQMAVWVGESPQVCHLDFHTGLGTFSRCQLMIQTVPESARFQWCEKAFGSTELVPTGNHDLTEHQAYQANGAMGDWLTQCFNDRPYHFVTAEFGTSSAIKVLSALRTENQAFHFCTPDSAVRTYARQRLEECFCPRLPRWREAVVSRGVSLIKQASHALTTVA